MKIAAGAAADHLYDHKHKYSTCAIVSIAAIVVGCVLGIVAAVIASKGGPNALEKQLDQAVGRQTDVNLKVDELNTQLFEYETEIVEIKTGNDLAGELGPLKFISSLTGIAMDQIINVLLLVIIFVFDPLAISLVIAANFAFAQINPVKKEQQYDPLDLNKDGIVDESEISASQKKIVEIEYRLENQPTLSGWRRKKLKDEIESLKFKTEDDTTKTY
jgi:peptidoglycan hydrolase CwlO-like protein